MSIKKQTCANRNVAVTISYNKDNDILLNKKWFRNSMNKIQSKDHRIEKHETNKISLSCFDNKTYIQNNAYDELAHG